MGGTDHEEWIMDTWYYVLPSMSYSYWVLVRGVRDMYMYEVHMYVVPRTRYYVHIHVYL